METFDDFRRRRFGGDLAASSSAGDLDRSDRATATLLRHRLHSIYETPATDDLPDAFRILLTQMSSKLDRA